MSIRIYNENLAGAATSQTSRAQELSHVSSDKRTAASSSSSAEDQVQISSLSEGIAAHGSQRAARVQSIAALYQSGNYQVKSSDIAHAMVSNALQAGGTESGGQ